MLYMAHVIIIGEPLDPVAPPLVQSSPVQSTDYRLPTHTFIGWSIFLCVTLTPYIKGPPGTLYCIKAQLAGIYLSARPLTRESYDRYTLLRKPSLLLGNGDTNYINHAQIGYVWEIKHET